MSGWSLIYASLCRAQTDFGIYYQLLFQPYWIAEKDENTTLQLFRHTIDDNDQFVESYGRPMYVLRNMSGMPYSLLRLGFPENDYEDFEIEYPNATFASQEASVPPHKHHETHFFDDDDFFETNLKNRGSEFESLLKNYTFVLHYTGRRWYGTLQRLQ